MTARNVIESRQNAVVKRLRALQAQRSDNAVLLEGWRLVDDALGAGVRIIEAAVSPAFEERHGDLVERLAGRGATIHRLAERVLASASDLKTPPGVMAVGEPRRFREEALFPPMPLVVVAAGIQNPGNLGGLLRTAEAAGATGAYLTDGCADPLSPKALRGSMGSAFRLPHFGPLPLDQVLARLRARGLRIYAGAATGTPHTSADLRRGCALLFGNEGAGLPDEALRQADERLAIPMAGAVESLNVGVAAGVILFEAARQRRG